MKYYFILCLLAVVLLSDAHQQIQILSSTRYRIHSPQLKGQRGRNESYNFTITATVKNNHHVHLKFSGLKHNDIETITIYRSFNDLSTMQSLDLNEWPITKTVIPGDEFFGEIIDSFTAHNTTYSYYVLARRHNNGVIPSNSCSAIIPDIFLPQTDLPITLLVDKCNYFLELRYNDVAVKRYPVNMGTAPNNRKLYYDCRSTPEGIYTAHYLRYTSDFHKAIGINYPNSTDRKRYNNARRKGTIPSTNGKPVSIGGSIQIHGGGIGNNWTWGCLAMRNNDLDEIFSRKSFKKGIPIIIVGSEFTRDSLMNKDIF